MARMLQGLNNASEGRGPLAERDQRCSIYRSPHAALARGRRHRPRRQARRTLVLYGLGAVWALASIVVGYSLGMPYLKDRREVGSREALAGRTARATTARDAETSVARSPTGGDELAASREAFARDLLRARRWTWLTAALAGTMAVVSLLLAVRLRQVVLTLRRRDEDPVCEAPAGDDASQPWAAAPPPSPIEMLRAARADLDEARREAEDALSVDPTLLGRDETLPLQAALLEDELIKLRRSRIALENRFSANLALGFDADLQGLVASGGNFLDAPSTTEREPAKVGSPSSQESAR